MEVTCPSGLRGEIRGMKIKELSLMSDAKLVRSGKLMTEIVKNCWIRTVDPGPYKFTSDVLPWAHMLHADQLCVFKQIRVATFGSEFEFEVTCDNDSCKHRFLWVMDLDKIPMKPLPETSRPYVGSNTYLTTSVNDKEVQFRLLEVQDELNIMRLGTDHGISTVTAGYMCRIKGVTGVSMDDPKVLAAWIENLDLEVGLQLQENMDAAEPGIGLRTLIECKRCETSWWAVAPLVQAFSKRKTKKVPPSLTTSASTYTTPSLTPPGTTPTSAVPESPSAT